MIKSRGAFITIEGGEGGGKSTQVRALVSRLKKTGFDAIGTREPGGSENAELIREALLSGDFEKYGSRTEALLFAAARIDHLDLLIKPALQRGAFVVCDRFHDSTRAYQGAHGDSDKAFLDSLDRVVLQGLLPGTTFLLDLSAIKGLNRVARRRKTDAPPDRFEKQSLDFHERLRSAFLEIASSAPERCVVIDATQTESEIEQAIWDAVSHRHIEGSIGAMP